MVSIICQEKLDFTKKRTSSTRCSDLSWSGSSEERFVSSSWGSLDVSNLWVLEVGNSVLLSTSSHGGVFWLNDSLDDLNGFTSSAMSSSHFTVHLGDGSAKGDISVLLVHVYDTSSSKISKHDSVVLDRVGFFLEDLTN